MIKQEKNINIPPYQSLATFFWNLVTLSKLTHSLRIFCLAQGWPILFVHMAHWKFFWSCNQCKTTKCRLNKTTWSLRGLDLATPGVSDKKGWFKIYGIWKICNCNFIELFHQDDGDDYSIEGSPRNDNDSEFEPIHQNRNQMNSSSGL